LRFAQRRCRSVHLCSHGGKPDPVLSCRHFGFADQRGSYRRIGADSGKLSGTYQCRDDHLVSEAPVVGLRIEVTPDEVHELQNSVMAGCDHLSGSFGTHILDDQPTDLLDRQPNGPCLVIAQTHALHLTQAGDEAVCGVLELRLFRGGDQGVQKLGILLEGMHGVDSDLHLLHGKMCIHAVQLHGLVVELDAPRVHLEDIGAAPDQFR
jgi:hypothetical protein